MLCTELSIRFGSNGEQHGEICNGQINEKGRCSNAENHITVNRDKSAVKGEKPTNEKLCKAADTWVEEARKMKENAIRYYRTAADKYEEAGAIGSAAFYRNKADRIYQE